MSTFEDAALVVDNAAILVLLLRSRNRNPRKVDVNKCACKHNVSFHDEEGCHGQVDGKPIKYDAYNDPTAYEKVRCSCRRYVGPNSSYDPGLDADLARASKVVKDKK